MIGISEYADRRIKWLDFADRDAERFRVRLGKPPMGGRWDYFVTLENRDATAERIAAELRYLTLNAGPEATVYILISAPGFAELKSKEEIARKGYILGYRSTTELKRTVLELQDFRQFLQKCLARVFVFADVCRYVLETGPSELVALQSRNQINLQLSDVLRREQRNGFLASTSTQISREDPTLDSGHGIFSFYVIEGLAQSRTFGDLLEFVIPAVKKRARSVSPKSQEPFPISQEPVVPLWDSPSTSQPNTAVLLPVFFQRPNAGQSDQQFEDAWSRAVERIRTLKSDEVLQFLTGLKQVAVRASQKNRDDLSVALEERGQEILLRYLTGDRFPRDPERPSAQDFRNASELFAQALELRPIPKDADLAKSSVKHLDGLRLFALGRSMIDRDTAGAAKVLNEALRSEPDLPETHNALGLLHLENGQSGEADLRAAVREFQTAMAMAPEWAYPRHNLALAYIELGEYEAAEKSYREAIARTPHYAYLHCNLGLLLHRINRLADAARVYKDAVRVFQAETGEINGRIRRLLQEEQSEEARYLQTRIALLQRYEAETHNALGALHKSAGKYDEAVAEYRTALSLRDDLLAARHNLAVLQFDRYLSVSEEKRDSLQLDAVIALLKKNVERADPYLRSRQKLADVYMTKKKFSDAESQYRAVALTEKSNTDALAGWARAIARQGRTGEALGLLQQRVRESPPPDRSFAAAVIAQVMGEVYDLASQPDQACQYFHVALTTLGTSAGSNEERRSVKARLKQCRLRN